MSEEKVIRTIPFDGKQDAWYMWSRIFIAKYESSGSGDILDGSCKVPDDSESLDMDVKKRLREKNMQLFNEMLLSCTDEVSFGLVDTARTKDFKRAMLP